MALPQVTLPLAGVVYNLDYNLDYDLGHDGIVGIKTGFDAAAGGCFLFAARHTVVEGA
jgi:D-alanyl-D-alanine carboxypeptidase (penicillin-binding protein 5/6)